MSPKNEQAPAYRRGRSDAMAILRCRSNRQQFFQSPLVRHKSSLDRWGCLDGHVFPAEVVEREPQRQHRIVIARSVPNSQDEARIRQPGKAVATEEGMMSHMKHIGTTAVLVASTLLGREVSAQTFWHVPPGYAHGACYGIDFGDGVGFGYGAGVGVPLPTGRTENRH